MTKFKKEQVVKCINTQGTKKLTEGKYYSVAALVEGTNNIFVVNDANELEQFSSERFVELVEEKEMTKFKIGDVVKVKRIWTHLSGRNYRIANINESDTGGMYHLQTLDDHRTVFPSGINYNEPRIYFWDRESIEDGFELVEEKEMNKYEKLLEFVKENNLTIDDLNDVAEHLDKIENLDFEIQDTKDLIEETEEELSRLYDELSELEDERNELLK